jgi:hypothetical protein
MATPVLSVLDFGGQRRAQNLANPTQAQDVATKAYVDSLIEGLAWKDNVRVSTQANLTIASPGATIDGITMATGDRVLVRFQTTASENGVYLWNGAATPMTRAPDASTFDEIENAVVIVDEGTSAGTTWRQTAVNGTLGSTNIAFGAFNTGAPAASETTSGIAEIATQSETDTGSDDTRIVSPLKLANWSGRARRFSANVGDGTSTTIQITHNFATRDIQAYVYENSGSYRELIVEKQHTTTNRVDLLFDVAPSASAHRVVVLA